MCWIAEPPAVADRGRPTGFSRFNVVAGAPSSFAVAFGLSQSRHREVLGLQSQDQEQVENDRRRHDDGNGQTNAGGRGANRRIHAALQAVRPRGPYCGP